VPLRELNRVLPPNCNANCMVWGDIPNWEAGTVCFSESFESLSEGLQNALWQLGKVPHRHRTDRLSTAVNNMSDPAEFTDRYQGLMRCYGLEGEKTQANHGSPKATERRCGAAAPPLQAGGGAGVDAARQHRFRQC